MKKFGIAILAALMLVPGCGNMSNLASGSLIGSGAGAAIGAGIGYLIGKDGKGAAIGAAIGTAVGGGTGAVIGNKMDKKAEELAALENAQVETVEDVNQKIDDTDHDRDEYHASDDRRSVVQLDIVDH